MISTPANVRNYFKLELLIARSYIILGQMFKNRYRLFTGGQLWDDSPTCGSNYSANVIICGGNFSTPSLGLKARYVPGTR